MPPSGCSQLILDLLAQSVVKVNSKGKDEEKQKDTVKLISSEGQQSRKIEDRENIDLSRKAVNVKSEDNWEEPKGKTFDELKEDIIKSVVYNHLKKVSPKLAKEFAYQFTVVKGSLQLENVVDLSYKKSVILIKEFDNENHTSEVSKDNTLKGKVIPQGLKPRCEECKRFFFNNASLKRHNLVHTGKKSHICDLCNKAFSRAGHLKIHKLVHGREKPRSCNICSKSFTQPSDLNRHKLVHTGEQPFNCNMCGKSFSQAGSLERHKMIHSRDKSCN